MTFDASPAAESSIAISDGRIAGIGVTGKAVATIDVKGACLLPGFIDCHTHAVFAGDRMAERAARLTGTSYEEIARAGGGIASTVEAVRAAHEDQLVDLARPRLANLLAEGVTTIEIKSGYGLDTGSEIKMLKAIRRLGSEIAVNVVATFLGAHAIPAGQDKMQYLRIVIEEMLPAVARDHLADAVDIYVETIGFDLDDLEQLFAAAKTYGLALRAHTEQLSNMHGSQRAAELGAASCDHLEYLDQAGIEAMARAGSVAVLLPGAFYFLGETQLPPVAGLRKQRVPIAIASDLNPGTSPINSLLDCMHMASCLFGLTADEVLLGVTRHAAMALGLANDRGTLEPGKRADFSLWSFESPRMLVYQMGGIRPDMVFHDGKAVIDRI